MFKRLQIFLVLFAWFLATGVQWDLVQTVGWGRMIATYSGTMPLLDAVERTFDGEMCAVCKLVNAAKQHESDPATPETKFKTKVVSVFQPAALIILTMPDVDQGSPSDRDPLSTPRAAPPTRPPRASAA